jgi:hypothetical protein
MKCLAFVAGCLLASSTASAEVQVTIHDGLVTVIAKDAPVRQIIAEWARVGQAKVVNAERIPGGPVTLELVNVPESQVLDTLLRSAAGYLAAPREVVVSNLSLFDRIVVMPTSNPPRTASAAPPPAFPQPQFAQPPNDDNGDDERPNANFPNRRGAAFSVPPTPTARPVQEPMPTPFGAPGQVPSVPPMPTVPTVPQMMEGQQPGTTYPSTPTAPYGGVAVPGMVAPPPTPQPGQIVQPGQQVQPGQVLQPGQVIQPGQVVQPSQFGPPTRRPGGE